MTAYTSTVDGDWNNAATWGGGGHPSSGADTATLATGHEVTIPVGVTITCGAITFSAGASGNQTKLTINGTLEMAGTMTTANHSHLIMGPGSALDTNGNTVAGGGTPAFYTFLGTVESRITITSTGSRSAWTNGASSLLANWAYVDVSGMGDCVFGRTHITGGIFHQFRYCTFTDCASVTLEATGTGANSGFVISHCDFRNQPGTPVASNKVYPEIYQTGAVGANPRVVEYCTWNTNVGQLMYIRQRVNGGCIFRRNIINNVMLNCDAAYSTTFVENYFDANIVYSQQVWFKDGGRLGTLLSNYFYNNSGDHPLGYVNIGISTFAYGNVFDTPPGSNKGANWFLYAPGGSSVAASAIKGNIWTGQGNAICIVNTGGFSSLTVSQNTFDIENDGTLGSGTFFPPILLGEGTANITGTVNIHSNIILDPDTSDTQDAAVDLINSTADQIDLLNYNVGWGYTGGSLTPPCKYTANVNVTAGEGPNDLSADPSFVDRTPRVGTWDASLGGPGTAANALAEFLKLNGGDYDSRYNVPALMSYVFAGYKIQQSSLRTFGLTGAQAGAGNYDAARTTSAATQVKTYLAGAFGVTL